MTKKYTLYFEGHAVVSAENEDMAIEMLYDDELQKIHPDDFFIVKTVEGEYPFSDNNTNRKIIDPEKLKMIVSLTIAKVDILKLKSKDGGYIWSMIGDKEQDQLNDTLVDINKYLLELK